MLKIEDGEKLASADKDYSLVRLDHGMHKAMTECWPTFDVLLRQLAGAPASFGLVQLNPEQLSQSALQGLLESLRIPARMLDYRIIEHKAENPWKEKFITMWQIRGVDRIKSPQAVDFESAIWEFLERLRKLPYEREMLFEQVIQAPDVSGTLEPRVYLMIENAAAFRFRIWSSFVYLGR